MSLQIRSRMEFDPAAGTGPFALLRDLDEKRPGSREAVGRERSAAASLPVLATANDAREVVRFLRKRPNGIAVVEAVNSEPKRIFEPRKLAAYEYWGLLTRDEGRLRLTAFGRELAESIEPECRLHRNILRSVPAYLLAVRSIYEEDLDIATHLDVLRFWSELSDEHSSLEVQDLEAAAVSFFSLCHAAELGTATVGKRGQPARLRVDADAFAEFLADDPMPREVVQGYDPAGPLAAIRTSGPVRRVFVCGGKKGSETANLKSLLSLAGYENCSKVYDRPPHRLLLANELDDMRGCQAGIFMVGPGDCEHAGGGRLSLNQGWLTSISVAGALFDRRVVVFWHGSTPAPAELVKSGLNVIYGEHLDWENALDLVNQIKELAIPLSE
jgi:hypothetical protein